MEELPLSADFTVNHAKNTRLKVDHRFTLGSLDEQTFSVRFDPFDKYLAQACLDGSIKVYNVKTGKIAFLLNSRQDSDDHATTWIRWRPARQDMVTKGVMVTVSANGSLRHWHVKSGKLLHTIHDEFNQILCVDYNSEGSRFATGGSDTIVRLYDELTKEEISIFGGDPDSNHSH